MNKKIFAALALAFVFGCASKGSGEASLIQQASAEHKCPPSEISVLNKRAANGGATYQLNICGRQVYYYYVNGAYTEAGKYSAPVNVPAPVDMSEPASE